MGLIVWRPTRQPSTIKETKTCLCLFDNNKNTNNDVNKAQTQTPQLDNNMPSPVTTSEQQLTRQEQARRDAEKSHCEYFRNYYIAIVGCFILAFGTLAFAPQKIREGDKGCSGGCGSQTSDCCLFRDSNVCAGRCLCSVRDSVDASYLSYCRDPEPTVGATAMAFLASF
jgi:hypothetical protein